MPNNAPANVATSPKPTSKLSCISPCGAINTPQKSNISPPIDSTDAVNNWMFSFILPPFVN